MTQNMPKLLVASLSLALLFQSLGAAAASAQGAGENSAITELLRLTTEVAKAQDRIDHERAQLNQLNAALTHTQKVDEFNRYVVLPAAALGFASTLAWQRSKGLVAIALQIDKDKALGDGFPSAAQRIAGVGGHHVLGSEGWIGRLAGVQFLDTAELSDNAYILLAQVFGVPVAEVAGVTGTGLILHMSATDLAAAKKNVDDLSQKLSVEETNQAEQKREIEELRKLTG
jgi:hypothetical protein